jgi:hypothetical protein
MMKKIDLKKQFKHLYQPSAKVTVGSSVPMLLCMRRLMPKPSV